QLLVDLLTGPATSAPCTLSLHDALPISTASGDRSRSTTSWRSQFAQLRASTPTKRSGRRTRTRSRRSEWRWRSATRGASTRTTRSEEHTSELQSRENLGCRLRLENKNSA